MNLPIKTLFWYRLGDNHEENLLGNPRNIRKRVLVENKQVLRLCRCKSTDHDSLQLDDDVICEPSGVGNQCAEMNAKVGFKKTSILTKRVDL